MEVNLNVAGAGTIDIGANCLIGFGVLTRTADYIFSYFNNLKRKQGHDPKNIIIEDDCWLGAKVVVLGGVRIGKGSVLGAGLIITNNIRTRIVAVDVPARVIKSRIIHE